MLLLRLYSSLRPEATDTPGASLVSCTPGGLLWCIVVALHVPAVPVQCSHSASQRPALASHCAVANSLITGEDPGLRALLKAESSWENEENRLLQLVP